MVAVRANGTRGIDVSKAVLESALLERSPGDGHRLLFERSPGDVHRLLLDSLLSGSLLKGEAFQCFLHLDPPLFDILRFFQLTVFRHSRITSHGKRGYPFRITPYYFLWGQDLSQ